MNHKDFLINNVALPEVSVLISVYNQIPFLKKALESALNQDYPNIEIIIGDDCSTDGNVEAFIEKYKDPRIKYFRNEQNLGVSGNYKRMLATHSSGVYAIVLNADDYWIDNSFISQCVSIFQEDSKVELVFGDIKMHLQGNNTFFEDKMHKKLSRITDGNQFFIDYNKGYSLPHLSCLYNRKRAVELKFYENDGISEDWGSLLKIIIGKKIGYIPNPIGILTRNFLNYSKNTSVKNLQIADKYINNLYKFAKEQNVFDPAVIDQWRFLMLKRHHIKWLVKLYFLDKNKMAEYKLFVKAEHPEIYKSILWDKRYWGYLMIRKSPFLLKLVFKNVLNQESFVADLLVHRNR